MNYYNGYTPKERDRKLQASHKIFPDHSHPYYKGACDMCGDPHSPVEPHSEDYSEPYLWERPAEYAPSVPAVKCDSRNFTAGPRASLEVPELAEALPRLLVERCDRRRRADDAV